MIEDICFKLRKNPIDIAINPRSREPITYAELISAIIDTGTTIKAAKYLGVGIRTVNRATDKLNLAKLRGGQTFSFVLLALIEHKKCFKCGIIKSYLDFSKYEATIDGLDYHCKDCKSKKYKEWYNNHRDEQVSRCASRVRSLDRRLTINEIEFLLEKYEYKCVICGYDNEQHLIDYGQRLHFDHIIPFSKGGKTETNNLQLLCRSCNSSKSNT